MQSFGQREKELLPPDVTRQLFMDRKFSVSRLEDFARCPFKHFVQHGLQPHKRKEWRIEASDSGSFYHEALEGFTRMLAHTPGWPDIDKKTCDSLMDAATAPLLDQMLKTGPMGDSARLRHEGERYKKTLRRAAWVFTRGAKNSSFRTTGEEVTFGFNEPGSLPMLPITLPDGTRAYLQGRIDRIDRYEGDEGLYLRIVDYKSSATELKANHIFWGAQLQLLLYLAAVTENTIDHRPVLPAGAFYFHVHDPIIPAPEDLSKIEQKLADALRMKGIALKDAAIIRLMDHGEDMHSLPAYLKADGTPSDNKQLATMEELRALIDRSRALAGKLIGRIQRGECDASPLCHEQESPCTYCDYAAICRTDPTNPENIREMGNMDMRQLLDIALAENGPSPENEKNTGEEA